MFEIFQGDDQTFELTFVDENDAVLNLTDYDIVFTVRKPYIKTVLIVKSTDDSNQIEVPTPANGIALLHFAGVDTAELKGNYEFDIQLTLPSGAKRTYDKDILLVKEDISAP